MMRVDGRQPEGDDKSVRTRWSARSCQARTLFILEVMQDQTGKRFALKVLLGSKVDDPSERGPFEFEAKLGTTCPTPT